MNPLFNSFRKIIAIAGVFCECPVVENVVDFDSKTVPSDDLLAKCYLFKFLEDENKYRCKIQSVNTGISISFDHTFKVASNIGFLRRDGKWINQYDSAFFIFNSDGKVLSWQFFCASKEIVKFDSPESSCTE